jgi:phospholipid/cholesterol/gamma-HCH transport system substrate-binding protein
METRPPTPGKVFVAVAFAISCFGLLLFLWVAFGGSVPLKPESYRVTIPFQEATQLAVESDVRISGVSVGKVKAIELSEVGNYAEAEIELDAKYAPIPSNTRSMLRQKTLLGETYVELTPGDPETGSLPEGGSLPPAQVSNAVQLDEIFRAFDAPTREQFRIWMQDASVAVRGRGADLNAALGNLGPFASSADDLMRILDSQDQAVTGLVRDTGATFRALSERPDQLRGLIENTESVFGTIADRDQQLIETFQVLPTFLEESKLTLERVDTFATDTNDLLVQLRPSARALSGTLTETAAAAPDLIRFFDGLTIVNKRARAGFSSLRTVLDDQIPEPLARVDSWLAELIPIATALDRYKRETTAVFANLSAATNAANIDGTGTFRKYLRTTAPFNPQALASLPSRWNGSRTNAYVKAGDYTKLAEVLDSFVVEQCTSGLSDITLDTGVPSDFPPDVAPPYAPPFSFIEGIQEFAYGGENNTDSDNIPRPECNLQPGSPSIGQGPDESTDYLHVRSQP